MGLHPSHTSPIFLVSFSLYQNFITICTLYIMCIPCTLSHFINISMLGCNKYSRYSKVLITLRLPQILLNPITGIWPHTTNTVLCMYAYMNFSTHCLCIWTDINCIAHVLCFPVFLPTLLPPPSNPLYHSYLSFQMVNLSKFWF